MEEVKAAHRTKAEKHDKFMRAYEERVVVAIAQTTEKHHKEQARLLSRHHRIIKNKRGELVDHYQLKEKQRQINVLHNQLENPSFT